jgi:transposase
MNRETLEQLSRDDLIDLILRLHTEVEALRLKVDEVQTPPSPPPTSKNSSQPPSRDQKANQPESAQTEKKKRGPPKGHPKHTRTFVSNPDSIVDVRPQQCPTCQTDLSACDGTVVHVDQITEIPEPRAHVIEVRHIAVVCPCCGDIQTADPPPGLERHRQFGARLEAMIVYYRHEQHMSYERTQATLHNLHGVDISQGGIDQVMQRAGRAAATHQEQITTQVRASVVINSDETGVRVMGETWWHWVFCTAVAVFHLIRKSRGAAVIDEVMGTAHAEVWGSDCLAAQMKAPATHHQLCLAHQLRDLHRVCEGVGSAWWARAMQAVFRAAIHLHHTREHYADAAYAVQVARIERILDGLLARSPPTKAGMRLCRRYRKHRASLVVFLHRTDVDPTNNVAERAVRPSVIHTKVMGSFRSKWGAETYAAVCSVIDTAECHGTTAFAALQALMGIPALPLPGSLPCE